jgi:hypothetical protein
VTVRRLTSAEYAYAIRDLAGADIDLGPGFVADSVGGEGFTNFGDVQFMQDGSLERYLEAAKTVADHAVIGSGPLAFYGDPGMSGFELSAIHRIHDIYRRYGFRAVAAEGGRAFGLERYGRAFYTAWQFAHRDALMLGDATLASLAVKEDLNPHFVQHLWSVLQTADASYPTSEVLSQFHSLPEPGAASEDEIRAACTKIQEFVIHWRGRARRRWRRVRARARPHRRRSRSENEGKADAAPAHPQPRQGDGAHLRRAHGP